MKAGALSLERPKRMAWSFFRTILIVGISFIILYPILQKISTAFKDKIDIYNPTVIWVPQHFTLDNFKVVIRVMDYYKALLGSIALSGTTMILQTITCALAGYAFAKLKFRGSGLLFGLVVFTIVVPPQTLMIPTYLYFKNFDIFGIIKLLTGKDGINLIDTYWPFVMLSMTGMGLKTGLYIYIFRQFFRGLPKELEEAAFVDGAGVFMTFRKIMLPNAIPAIITVMLFSFVWQWNDIYYTTLFLTNSKVIASQLAALPATTENYIGIIAGQKMDYFYKSMLMNTGVLLGIIPLIILYIFVQRHFVQSVERTGLIG